MSFVHHLSSIEAQKELTEAVKETQGSRKKASWKAEARPCWWINNRTVTLRDGTQVSTGLFQQDARRKWKKSHFQAALFLYEQWKHGETSSPKSKEDVKAEEEIEEEIEKKPRPAPRRTRRGKKEEQILQDPSPGPRHKKKGKGKIGIVEDIIDDGTPEARDEPEEEEAAVNPAPTRVRRNLRLKDESVTPERTSPITTPKTRSHRQTSSSFLQNDEVPQSDESPTPILRRRRARGRGKEEKASPQIHVSLHKRQVMTRKARNGKALVRNTAKAEPRKESILRPRKGADIESESATPSRLTSSASKSDDDCIPIRTRRRANDRIKPTSSVLQKDRKMSPGSSGVSTRSSPSSDPATTRKRPIPNSDGQVTASNPRTPLQERNDQSYLQDKRSRKKRRTMVSDKATSEKENQAPPAIVNAKSARLRSPHGRNGKPGEHEAEPTETGKTSKDDGDKEAEIAIESAEQQRKAKRIRFLRDQIEKAKAMRDRELELVEGKYAVFETDCNIQKTQVVEGLRSAYRAHRLKFTKEILDMPMSTFANEHGGNTDEWLIHYTEEGVNRTFEALHNGEDPKVFGMRAPKTPAAKSRLAALTKTARKTQRRVATEAAAAGLTVRRSQRTAAKVATERTRAIVSCTPRTAKKEAVIQGSGIPALSRTGRRVMIPGVVASAGISRQQMTTLAQSIKKAENPLEALRAFTSHLQREVME